MAIGRAEARPSEGTCFRRSSLSSRSNLQFSRKQPVVIRGSKPSRAACSPRMAPADSRRKFAWNGQPVSAPPPAALNPMMRVSSSIAGLLCMARRKSIARCATSWHTSWPRRAPAGAGSHRTGRSGGAPALISELGAKRGVTISPSRFAGRNAVTITPVRIAGAILPAPGRCAALRPVSVVAAPTITDATISGSNSDSLGVRQTFLLTTFFLFPRRSESTNEMKVSNGWLRGAHA